jgi:hypothetical protein
VINRLALIAAVTLMAAGSAAATAVGQPRTGRQPRASAQQTSHPGVTAQETRHRRAPAAPDAVVAFNQLLQQVVTAPGAQPPTIHPTRTMAITQIAVYDAVNGILRQGKPMLFGEAGPRHASADAAAAAAARTALDALLPAQRAEVDAFYMETLAQMGSSLAVRGGLRFGERAAHAVLADRADDGASAVPPPFATEAGPGEYQLTPPAFAVAGFTQTAHVTPFVLLSASQFRPAPPPALSSPRYAADFDEVRSLGELNSTTRTADETAVGRFWGAAPIWIVWNQIADQAAVAMGNSLEQNARLFALLDTTLADGAIALYDAKYAYHRWRPITAITATDQGNANTVADPTWVPLANTANDPSYPGAHAEFSEAAATVLQDFFGTDVFSFSLSNPTIGITRTFDGFSQAANEAAASRIFAGQHFRYDEDAGQTLGGQVARFVLAHAFGPARRGR